MSYSGVIGRNRVRNLKSEAEAGTLSRARSMRELCKRQKPVPSFTEEDQKAFRTCPRVPMGDGANDAQREELLTEPLLPAESGEKISDEMLVRLRNGVPRATFGQPKI